MCHVYHRFATVSILVLALANFGPAQQPGEEGKPVREASRPIPADLYGDPLPFGAPVRMGTVQLRYDAQTGGAALAFSPDSKVLAMGDIHSLRLWSVDTGKLLLQLKEIHEFGSLMFSPDGKWLATVENQSICLRDAQTGKLVRRISAGQTRILAFSPDSKLLATYAGEGSVLLWHSATGEQAFELRAPKKQWVDTAVFTSDGRTLITMGASKPGRDKMVCRWDLATKALVKTVSLPFVLRVFPPRWRTIHLSPDGQTVAAAPYSSEAVRLFDTATGKERGSLQGDVTAARLLAFSPDSRTLATAWGEANAREATLSLWDAATGKRLGRFPVPGRDVGGLQISPDGRTIVTDHMEARVRLWDTATGQPRWQRPAHDGQIWSLSFTEDSQAVASGSGDGTIRVWDAVSGRHKRELAGHRWGVFGATVLPTGHVLSYGGDGFLRLQELRTGRELNRLLIDQEPEKLTQPAHHIECFGTASDGRTAAALSYSTAGKGSNLDVWDLSSGRLLLHQATASEEHFRALSPDAKLMLGFAQTIQPSKKMAPGGTSAEEVTGTTVAVIREVASGRQILALPQPNDSGVHTAFSPDSQVLATVTYRSVREGNGYRVDRHTIHLWELATGKERLAITNAQNGYQYSYEKIAFGPDGRTLATARMDRVLQLWDVATGQELLRRTGYDASVNALAFAPNGKALATGHSDSTILVWDLAPEQWQKERQSHPLDARELEATWADLANNDARRAHTAIWKLVAVPGQAVPLLRDRLRPAPTVPADRLRQLLKDLDSSRFRQREQATKELADLEEQAEPALQDALKGNLLAEARRRIEALLAAPRLVRSPDKLRSLRAIQVLEQSDVLEARHILEMLAKGAPDARLTQEAKASLERLAKRPIARP